MDAYFVTIIVMKRIFFPIFVLLAFASCQEHEFLHESSPIDTDLYASIESINVTKTALDVNRNVLWSEGDCVVAFMRTTLGQRYQIKEEYVGSTSGGFRKVDNEGGDDLMAGQEIDHNVVVYPYSDQIWCMKHGSDTPAEAYKVNIVLPETQRYAENTFADGSFPMLAISSGNNLTFKNICGGLKLHFRGSAKIKSICLEGLGGEKLSGSASVVGYVDGSAPTITLSETASGSVTLDCGDGVQLDPTDSVTFIIALPPVEFKSGMKITVTDTDGFSKSLTNPASNTIKRSSLLTFPTITYKSASNNLSAESTANCYIVSRAGEYKFTPTQGNTTESVGAISAVEVLWESYGTDVAPTVGDLIKDVKYEDGNIVFNTSETFREGNAVIAAKDDQGTILWSWHIWMTDKPNGQEYSNNAGIMMDRNLGATSATPGELSALGLMYQWGRKDPFPGASSIGRNVLCKTTGTWPSGIDVDQNTGTIAYSIAHPTTLMNYKSYDWLYDWETNLDNTRWQSVKTKYDPCPSGWRVPDGDTTGVWMTALQCDTYLNLKYDSEKRGMDLSLIMDVDGPIWYPEAGHLSPQGQLSEVGEAGLYWSVSTLTSYAQCLLIIDASLYTTERYYRAYAASVRCIRE